MSENKGKMTQILHVKEKCLDCWRYKKVKGVWVCPYGLNPVSDGKVVVCNGFIARLPKVAPARKEFERETKKWLA